MIQCDLCQEFFFNFKCVGICIAPDSSLSVQMKTISNQSFSQYDISVCISMVS